MLKKLATEKRDKKYSNVAQSLYSVSSTKWRYKDNHLAIYEARIFGAFFSRIQNYMACIKKNPIPNQVFCEERTEQDCARLLNEFFKPVSSTPSQAMEPWPLKMVSEID